MGSLETQCVAGTQAILGPLAAEEACLIDQGEGEMANR